MRWLFRLFGSGGERENAIFKTRARNLAAVLAQSEEEGYQIITAEIDIVSTRRPGEKNPVYRDRRASL